MLAATRSILGRLQLALSTRDLADVIAGHMGEPDAARDLKAFLVGIAPVMEQAHRNHTGTYQNAQGSICVPWVWEPAAKATSVPILTPGPLVALAAPPLIDEWEVPGTPVATVFCVDCGHAGVPMSDGRCRRCVIKEDMR